MICVDVWIWFISKRFHSQKMTLQIRIVTPQDHALWDSFVDAHFQGTPFHLFAWKNTIENTFGYKPQYLWAVDAGKVRAVLPLFLIKNPLLGRVLLSSPFAMYGGILADSPHAHAAMVQHIKDLAARLEVQYLELRNAYPEQCAGFERISRYVTFTHEAKITDPEQLLTALPMRLRNKIRKSLKYSYSSRIATDPTAFYNLMALNYRRLGTPIFPRQFFSRILENFGPRVDLREVLLDQKVAAASINFLYRSEMHTYYAASDQTLLHAAPNNFMYFDYLLWTAANGFARFDFGRSSVNTGTFEFKRHWLTDMRELPYEILLVKRKSLPNFTPKNPRFETALKIWRRLPLPITKVIGPRVIGLFP
jgi:FemAB-related protein (PEP-CTERM system-associated)